ncbi:hypothetical protein VOI54_14375 [Tamlana sp. 2201CG12-4]|nr:hypothetical protein [Tamlana sp. 2201CG12-4]
MRFKNTPELLILDPSTPVDFISKVVINYNNGKSYLIKFRKEKTNNIIIINEINDSFFVENKSLFRSFSEILKKYKTSLIIDSFSNFKREYIGSDGGVNLDELITFIKKNE